MAQKAEIIDLHKWYFRFQEIAGAFETGLVNGFSTDIGMFMQLLISFRKYQ